MLSLAVINGDLAIGPGGYLNVVDAGKVKQEIGLALREPFGIDRFHPGWGSILDGDIGQAILPGLDSEVRIEVIRIVQNYMAVQQAKLASDTVNGGTTRLSVEEIIHGITEVNVRQVEDKFLVRLALRLGGQQQVVILQSVLF